jgi:hypothetical protein
MKHKYDTFQQGFRVEKASRGAFLAFWITYFSTIILACFVLYLYAKDYP